jgi:hypothetical protein
MPKVKFYISNLDQTACNLSWIAADKYFDIIPEIIRIYPELKEHIDLTKTNDERYKTFKYLLKPNYDKHISENESIYESYIKLWDKYNKKYMNTMEHYFNIDWPNEEETFEAYVSDLPVFPRDVEHHSFYIPGYANLINYCQKHTNVDIKDKEEVKQVFINNYEDVGLSVIMHECCHFFFFEKCKEIFPNLDYDDCNNPSLLWHLSEMAIEPILNSDEVQDIFKYKFKANSNCYLSKKDDHLMMDDIKDIFNNNSIEDAITMGYQYLVDNEKELREANHDDTPVGSLKKLETNKKNSK